MFNTYKKYSLHELNKEMQLMLNQNNKVNHLEMFVATMEDDKLSVTLKPEINSNHQYHGLHPKFDETMLRLFLKKLKINSASEFWKSVEELQNQDVGLMNLIIPNTDLHEEYLIKLHEDKEYKNELEINLLGSAILQIGSHFGYCLYAENKAIYDDIIAFLLDRCSDTTTCFISNDKTLEVKLFGIWSHNYIENICTYFDVICEDNKLIVKRSDKLSTNNNYLCRLLSFKEDWEKYYKLITSDVYYSGVMPCVKKIDYEVDTSYSNRVKYVVFNVVRTTFATVDLMDNAEIMKHDFFIQDSSKNYQKCLYEFNHYEDYLQDKYLYSSTDYCNNDYRAYECKMINKLNQYLKHSLNTHTIAVSSNLVTEDGYLITGKRGSLNIDSGELYCSANGQSEFCDENVEFYRKSVFEDMPTMDYYSKYRIDLRQEIERECMAELGVSSLRSDWKYHGVSYLSINNNVFDSNESYEKSQNVKHRRMHFNVLVSNILPLDFKDVLKTYTIATENFENEIIIGIKTKVFRNSFDLLKIMVITLYHWLENNKSRLFLMLILISVLFGRVNYLSLDANSYFDIAMVLIYFLMTLFEWYKGRKVRKKMVTKYFYLPKYLTNGHLSMIDILNKLSKKANNSKLHAIFRVMYIMHFLELINGDE